MADQAEFACPDHQDVHACPDKLVSYSQRFNEYGLLVHDGEGGYATSSIVIAFCPWCGARLPPSRRDELLS